MKVDKTKWNIFPIKDIAIILNGYAFKSEKYCSDGIRIIRITNVQDGFIEDNDPKFYSFSIEKELQRFILHEGDLLISLTGNVGRVGILNDSFLPAALNQRVGCIRPTKKACVKFLYYQLRKESFKKDCIRSAKGVAQLNMSTEWLKEYKLFVPSLSEQQAIATELDSIQTIIDGYKAQLADLDALAQSIFLDIFGDPISNPKEWKKSPLKELVIKMSTGPFGSMLHKDDYDIEGIPAVNPQDIKGNSISNENIALVNFNKAKELNKYILHTNDIVIARRGDLSKCAIISQSENGWLCGTGSFFLTLKDLNPTLFYYFYTSISVQKYLNDKCIGATMPNLNQGILSSLNFPLPPLPLQQQFAEKIGAIERQKELIRQQLTDAEQLMSERMQYYFN